MVKPYDPTKLGVTEESEDPNVLRDEDGIALPSFDPKYKEDFQGLLYLGALQEEFEWLGHRFVVRTLRGGEILALGLVLKKYQDTMGQDIAWATAHVALCLVSVDDEELPIPIGESHRINEWAQLRFNYIRDNWYAPVTSYVYSRSMDLAGKADKVLEAMGKASAPEDSTPTSKDI